MLDLEPHEAFAAAQDHVAEALLANHQALAAALRGDPEGWAVHHTLALAHTREAIVLIKRVFGME